MQFSTLPLPPQPRPLAPHTQLLTSPSPSPPHAPHNSKRSVKWRPPATARCRPNCNTFWRRSRRKRRYEGRKRRAHKRPCPPGRGRETGVGSSHRTVLSTPSPFLPPPKRTSDPANRGPRHRPVLGQVHGHARPVAGVARGRLLQRLRAALFGHDPVYRATVPSQIAGSGWRGAGVMRIVCGERERRCKPVSVSLCKHSLLFLFLSRGKKKNDVVSRHTKPPLARSLATPHVQVKKKKKMGKGGIG